MSTSTQHATAREPTQRTFDGTSALWIVGALIGVAFMGSGLITPLYDIYEKQFGFSQITLTLIYASYVVGNLASLLFFGKVSDRFGRRIVALASILTGLASMLLFLFASNTAWLFFARVLSGISVGLASGAGVAWVADLSDDKARATLIASVANAFGFALGPLLAGVIAQYVASPLHSAFYAYIPLLIATGVCVARTRETVKIRKEAPRWDLVGPRVGVPGQIRAQFVPPAIAAFGTYALVGYYAALIPSFLTQSLHRPQPIIAGAVVFELAFLAGIATIAARSANSRTAMLVALLLLVPSVALLLLAQSMHSLPILALASACGSLCWGLGARGSLQVVNDIAPAQQRAEVASAYFIAAFVGNSIPVIGIGVITAASNGAIASLAFGCTIAAFAIVAFVMGLCGASTGSA